MSDARLDALRDLIQEDVGNRGLRADPADNLVTRTAGDFAAACASVAAAPHPGLAVVTGFYIPTAEPPCGETDGPLGALYLARALAPLGVFVVLATDPFCAPALEAGLDACGLADRVPVRWLADKRDPDILHYAECLDAGGPLTHWVALERVGPSHTPETLRDRPGTSAEVLARYLREVPPGHYGRCHTMRGRDVTAMMRPAHRLFERAAEWDHKLTTIGIGDGGNEIGMGKIPWEVIRRNVPNGGLTACRVPCDHLIVCGVSNWGAYALAAGVALLRGEGLPGELFDVERERELLRVMVEAGPLVDGVTGKLSVSVDGLDFDRYAEPLRRIPHVLNRCP